MVGLVSQGRIFTVAVFAVAALAVAGVPRDGVERFSMLEPAAGNAQGIVPHKALYQLKLASAQAGAGLADIKGEMFFKWDDACDAWTSDHRFSVRYDYPEQMPQRSASHYVSWESKTQDQLHFSSERHENGKLTEQIKGSATRAPDGSGSAVYTRPESLRYDLPQGFLLPSGHTLDILRRARSGEKFFTATLFDGTDADGPVEVSAFIGRESDVKPSGEGIDADLAAARAWNVRMAVFPLKDGDTSAEPSYEIQIVLHENGVVSHMMTDYKSFSVEQRLTALEKLPTGNCQ